MRVGNEYFAYAVKYRGRVFVYFRLREAQRLHPARKIYRCNLIVECAVKANGRPTL